MAQLMGSDLVDAAGVYTGLFEFSQDGDLDDNLYEIDPRVYFDNKGLLLIRAKDDFNSSGADTIESSITIESNEETLLATFNTEGQPCETFELADYDTNANNRIHIKRG